MLTNNLHAQTIANFACCCFEPTIMHGRIYLTYALSLVNTRHCTYCTVLLRVLLKASTSMGCVDREGWVRWNNLPLLGARQYLDHSLLWEEVLLDLSRLWGWSSEGSTGSGKERVCLVPSAANKVVGTPRGTMIAAVLPIFLGVNPRASWFYGNKKTVSAKLMQCAIAPRSTVTAASSRSSHTFVSQLVVVRLPEYPHHRFAFWRKRLRHQ